MQRRFCPECRREAERFTRGVCLTCYQRARRAGTLEPLNPREHMVTVTLSDEELEAIRAEAEKDGAKLAAWIRDAVLGEVGRRRKR